MNVYITYFYRLRFLPDNMIPVSTAMYNPKWYTANGKLFIDNRGVVNGIAFKALSPHKISSEDICVKDCPKDPRSCSFLVKYDEYINSLDFYEVYSYLEKLVDVVKQITKTDKDYDVCLMVYEKPDNPCSERKTLIDYFAKHGIEVKEF